MHNVFDILVDYVITATTFLFVSRDIFVSVSKNHQHNGQLGKLFIFVPLTL